MRDLLTAYVSDMLAGKTDIIVTSSAEIGLIVGTPVYGVDGSVEGAVFYNQTLMEVNAALNGMNMALLISGYRCFSACCFCRRIWGRAVSQNHLCKCPSQHGQWRRVISLCVRKKNAMTRLDRSAVLSMSCRRHYPHDWRPCARTKPPAQRTGWTAGRHCRTR